MMPVVTYMKNKQKNIQSKYHHFTKRFESKYELIHMKLTSRFHSESTERELIHSKINNLITQSTESIESKIKSKRFIPFFSRTSTQKNYWFYPDVLDWFHGRFSGQIIRIVIREGKIIEKVFLTPKGNRIFVKRSKLELQLRSIPVIQIKFKIRFRLMPILQSKLKATCIKGI
tara:strand:+ start:2905 stop:3423 length:519 start_codon:yes stop_codon:yes gene_type:complete